MNTEQALQQRSDSKCELCSSEEGLTVYPVPPVSDDSAERCILACESCQQQIEKNDNASHWHCLKDSMWTQQPAVQVMAWRLLKRSSAESWAQDLLDMLYLDEETQQWAEEGIDSNDEESDSTAPTLDSNGTALADGDTVTLIKDLVVKGAGFTAKRGTAVRGISLTNNPEHIEGRVNGTRIVLLTCFLKRSN